MKKYMFIYMYTNGKVPIGATVTYSDGSVKEVSDALELRKIILEFAKQEGVSPKELCDDVTKVVTNEKDGNLIVTPNESKKDKGKFKKAIVTVTSLATAAVIGFVSHGYFLNKNNDSKKSESSKTYTMSVPTPTASLPIENDRLTEIVGRIYNGDTVSEDDLLFAMNQIPKICYKNIPEVIDLLNGKKMTGRTENINFYDMFPKGSIERFILKGYCRSRDVVIDNAHAQMIDTTKFDIADYLDEVCDFTFNGTSVDYFGTPINFYSLSPIARYMVVNLGMQTLQADTSYTIKINGREWGYNELSNAYAELIATLGESLENSSKKK